MDFMLGRSFCITIKLTCEFFSTIKGEVGMFAELTMTQFIM